MNLFRKIYFQTRFYYLLCLLIVLAILSHLIPILYFLFWLAATIIFALLFIDLYQLFFSGGSILGERICPIKLSNGDSNIISINIENNYKTPINCTIYDEPPIEFEERDIMITKYLAPNENSKLNYTLIPSERGLYIFGSLNLYASTNFQILERRFEFNKDQSTAVYPSFLHLKRYQMLVTKSQFGSIGFHINRKIGQSLEFEQIRDYVQGDDIRCINWKATARGKQIMVNQFQEEKAKTIYSIIDLGRRMEMPFEELSLADYSINSTLALSSIALKKGDKPGIISFSNKIHSHLKASNKTKQFALIQESLFHLKSKQSESNFKLLFSELTRKVSQRSLILIYCNFPNIQSVKRQLPALIQLNKKHQLMLISFRNSEVEYLLNKKAKNTKEILHQTLALNSINNSDDVNLFLSKKGFKIISCSPNKLSTTIIKKYLALKASNSI